MAHSIPSTMKQWKVTGMSGFDDLKYEAAAPVPKLGDKEVLVKSARPPRQRHCYTAHRS